MPTWIPQALPNFMETQVRITGKSISLAKVMAKSITQLSASSATKSSFTEPAHIAFTACFIPNDCLTSLFYFFIGHLHILQRIDS